MFLKRTSLVLMLATALGLAGAASAVATPTHASLQIRHQSHGCHSWSVDGGAFKARQSITLRHGGWLAVTNNDVMPHTLVLTSGPSLRIAHAKLGHVGSSLKLTLTKAGVYHFTTKAGEDYTAGIKTTGEDNALQLTVIVS
jgi:plastocyanin